MAHLVTDLRGKVANMPDFRQEALLPLFEAVINAVQALEDIKAEATGEVTVTINRKASKKKSGKQEEQIIAFDITDNGIGFTDANFNSFLTSDSTLKLEKGGKGVGRFTWLKAFERVQIESVYKNGSGYYRRKILFSIPEGIVEKENIATDGAGSTTIRLQGFRKEYRQLPTAYKTTTKIAQRIFEHCLSYYITGKALKIRVTDGDNTVYLPDLYDRVKQTIKKETFIIKGEMFSLSHIRLYSTHQKMHNMVLCAHSRDVISIDLARQIGTSSQFDEDDGKFVYCAYIAGDYLDANVTQSRTAFEFPDEHGELFGAAYPISAAEIGRSVEGLARKYLDRYLKIVEEKKRDLVARFVENNPSLRSVPHYCPEVYSELEPNSSSEKVNEVLYKYKGKAELSIQARGASILRSQASSVEEIETEYDAITEQIDDFQKDNLARYVTLRKMIIDLLEKKIEINKSGKYLNEDIIHDIIFPRRSISCELLYEEHNLWLIDEQLTFHEFAFSDKPFNEFSKVLSTERPDVVCFAEIDDERTARSVSVLEFKKPQRTSFDEDPARQLYRYVRRINEREVLLPNGRELYTNQSTRFYCYAICDITPAIREYAENSDYAVLNGERGFFKYNRTLNASTYVIDFDKIVVDAKRRHKAFFEKLGIHGNARVTKAAEEPKV